MLLIRLLPLVQKMSHILASFDIKALRNVHTLIARIDDKHRPQDQNLFLIKWLLKRLTGMPYSAPEFESTAAPDPSNSESSKPCASKLGSLILLTKNFRLDSYTSSFRSPSRIALMKEDLLSIDKLAVAIHTGSAMLEGIRQVEVQVHVFIYDSSLRQMPARNLNPGTGRGPKSKSDSDYYERAVEASKTHYPLSHQRGILRFIKIERGVHNPFRGMCLHSFCSANASVMLISNNRFTPLSDGTGIIRDLTRIR
jgi:hypothetical protein